MKKKCLGKKKRMMMDKNLNHFLNVGPYITQNDRLNLEKKENQKKWINPRGFITSVKKHNII